MEKLIVSVLPTCLFSVCEITFLCVLCGLLSDKLNTMMMYRSVRCMGNDEFHKIALPPPLEKPLPRDDFVMPGRCVGPGTSHTHAYWPTCYTCSPTPPSPKVKFVNVPQGPPCVMEAKTRYFPLFPRPANRCTDLRDAVGTYSRDL